MAAVQVGGPEADAVDMGKVTAAGMGAALALVCGLGSGLAGAVALFRRVWARAFDLRPPAGPRTLSCTTWSASISKLFRPRRVCAGAARGMTIAD